MPETASECFFKVCPKQARQAQSLDCDTDTIFSRAKRKLGIPGEMEAYAFVPAPALGGPMLVDNLKPNKAPAYLSILAQSNTFRLGAINSRLGIDFIRDIG